MSIGYVYILLNPSLRSQRYKIGMTTKTPEERAAAISGATGVPEPFEVAYSKKVSDCRMAERLIMGRLNDRRVQTNREFFDISLQDAVDTLNEVASIVGVIDEVESLVVKNDSSESSRIDNDSEPVQSIEDAELTLHVPPKKVRRSSGSSRQPKRTIEDHLSVCEKNIQTLFERFRRLVKDIDPCVKENCWTYGVAYRASQNFVELYFRSNRLEICLRNRTYIDPENLLGAVPDTYKWTLNRRFLLEDQSQLEYVLSLVRQSYEDVA